MRHQRLHRLPDRNVPSRAGRRERGAVPRVPSRHIQRGQRCCAMRRLSGGFVREPPRERDGRARYELWWRDLYRVPRGARVDGEPQLLMPSLSSRHQLGRRSAVHLMVSRARKQSITPAATTHRNTPPSHPHQPLQQRGRHLHASLRLRPVRRVSVGQARERNGHHRVPSMSERNLSDDGASMCTSQRRRGVGQWRVVVQRAARALISNADRARVSAVRSWHGKGRRRHLCQCEAGSSNSEPGQPCRACEIGTILSRRAGLLSMPPRTRRRARARPSATRAPKDTIAIPPLPPTKPPASAALRTPTALAIRSLARRCYRCRESGTGATGATQRWSTTSTRVLAERRCVWVGWPTYRRGDLTRRRSVAFKECWLLENLTDACRRRNLMVRGCSFFFVWNR